MLIHLYMYSVNIIWYVIEHTIIHDLCYLLGVQKGSWNLLVEADKCLNFFPHSGKPQNRGIPHLWHEAREGDAY